MLERETEAEENFRLALEMHERLQAPYWIARTQIDYADFLLRRNQSGDVDTARKMLVSAADIATAHGYEGVRRKVASLQ